MEPLLCPRAIPAKLKVAISASDVDDLLIGASRVASILSWQFHPRKGVLHLKTTRFGLKNHNSRTGNMLQLLVGKEPACREGKFGTKYCEWQNN
jgi:hypothetical protein